MLRKPALHHLRSTAFRRRDPRGERFHPARSEPRRGDRHLQEHPVGARGPAGREEDRGRDPHPPPLQAAGGEQAAGAAADVGQYGHGEK